MLEKVLKYAPLLDISKGEFVGVTGRSQILIGHGNKREMIL